MKDYERVTLKQGEPKIVSKRVYNRLRELEDKIENGTLIELPCPIGTAIYYLDCNQHDGWWIEAVLFDFEYLDLIGKYAFLTKAEAEKKLEELREKK